MRNNDLIARLRTLGFPLFETEGTRNANATLADVVKSNNLRLWEGFPVILINSAEKELFNYDMVKWHLKKLSDKSNLASLMMMSLALYKSLNLKLSWADKFYNTLAQNTKKRLNNILTKIKKDEDFEITHHVMSSQRLKSIFNNYFNQARTKFNDLLSIKEELNLEYSLSQIFSPKQKELFLKKLKREKLTKTEKEYFSRVTKKKILALANPELHHLSLKLLQS